VQSRGADRTQDARRAAAYDDARRDGARDHRTRRDHRVLADRHAGQDRRTGADPVAALDHDRRRDDLVPPCSRADRMTRRDEVDPRSDEDLVADRIELRVRELRPRGANRILVRVWDAIEALGQGGRPVDLVEDGAGLRRAYVHRPSRCPHARRGYPPRAALAPKRRRRLELRYRVAP
jgi:hypothetical protein